jgi:hypothetical protein
VPVTVKISGGGKAYVTTTGIGAGDITNIEVTVNPTGKTAVTVSTKNNAIVSIGGVDIQGSIATFSAPFVDLGGDFVADGTVGTLKLHNVIGYDITLHNNAALPVNSKAQAAVTLNDVANCQFDANDEPIKSLTLARWLDTSGPTDIITSPTLGSLSVKGNKAGLPGDFQADMAIGGAINKATIGHDLSGDWSASAIGSLTVKNNMTNAHLTLTQAADSTLKLWALGTLSVTGSIDDSWISSVGNIKSVTTTRLLDSTIFAGVAATHDTLPAPNGDGVFDLFYPGIDTFSQSAYIKSLTVKGTKDGSTALQNSNIAANWLGTIKLVNGQLDNGGTPFGLAAHTLTKFSYADYADATMKYTWPNKDPNDIASPHLPPAFDDFVIRLI